MDAFDRSVHCRCRCNGVVPQTETGISLMGNDMFSYPADNPILKRALEIEKTATVKALGPFEARRKALYMSIYEATGRDPSSVTFIGPSFLLDNPDAKDEMQKEV